MPHYSFSLKSPVSLEWLNIPGVKICSRTGYLEDDLPVWMYFNVVIQHKLKFTNSAHKSTEHLGTYLNVSLLSELTHVDLGHWLAWV